MSVDVVEFFLEGLDGETFSQFGREGNGVKFQDADILVDNPVELGCGRLGGLLDEVTQRVAVEVVIQLTGSTNQDVDEACLVGIDGGIQRVGFRFESSFGLHAPFDNGLILTGIDQVDTTVDGLLGRLDCLQGDGLLQMGKFSCLHETGIVAEDDRGAKFQQFGAAQSLGDEFEADAVYISVGDTNV